jgi:AraC-like DNA-binding protein
MSVAPDALGAQRGAPIRYMERQPAADLAPWVLSYWSFQSDTALPPGERYTVWPDGCTSIGIFRMARGPSMVLCVGPRHTATHPPVFAGGRLWGVRFWPDCLGPLFGLAARALRDLSGPAPEPIASRFAPLVAALPAGDDPATLFPALEHWLRGTLQPPTLTPPDPRIRAAIRAIVAARGEIRMESVAREANLGLRQLQRLFPEVTGLTLRDYARVRRLREALALHLREEGAGWSRVAADSGFVDHAHLTREFLALTGLPPTAAARQMARTDHRDVAP